MAKRRRAPNPAIDKLQDRIMVLVAHHAACDVILQDIPPDHPDPAGLRAKATVQRAGIEHHLAMAQRALADALTGMSIMAMVRSTIAGGGQLPPLPPPEAEIVG